MITEKHNRKPTQSEDKRIITLDVKGLYCPMPVLKTRKMFDSLKIGDILQVITNAPATESDLQNWARSTGQKIVGIQRQDSEISFSIEKIRAIS
ncbi:MAG: sulfurtransferase TusA family protein [Desulfobacterales bacterium]|uniref:Sulfurtransferase TusA family protein n=1 Tax=Candidatus Desulfatibia profunda TaxID=2841695 RepID=A0A8J6NNF0_9BACT|nr:sulfurtransferase TusA family protein [Candidatus Desulfatibia profunda]MBL7178606.1 sulfurtransferase TusA family protein [Desulfobacterales bacterium]